MSFWQKIKAFFALKRVVSDATKEVKTMDGVKPGWQTTEFWGKTLAQVFVIANTIWHKNLDPQWGISLVAAIEAVYTLGRSIVKGIKG